MSKTFFKKAIAATLSFTSASGISVAMATATYADVNPYDNPFVSKAEAEKLATKIQQDKKGYFEVTHEHPRSQYWDGVTYAHQGTQSWGQKNYQSHTGVGADTKKKIDSISPKTLGNQVRNHDSSMMRVRYDYSHQKEQVRYAFWDTYETKKNGKTQIVRHYVKNMDVKWGQKF